MAHNINTYIGRQPAWHNLGTVTGQHSTAAELLAHEGFQFIVFKSQLRDGLGRPVEAWGTFRWNMDDKLAGSKDRAEFLGAVGRDYQVIQHQEGFGMIDALVNSASETGAHYETAGVLGNGERVWALADLGLSISIGDDKQSGYLLFCTGHDGSMAHQYRLTFTRVVCQNTLNAALSSKSRSKLTVRHTQNAVSKLQGAKDALVTIASDVKTVEDKLLFLAGRKVTRESVTVVMDRLFPKQKTDDDQARDTTRRTNIIGDILRLYEHNDGNAYPDQRGTAYNLLNAITEYADHSRGSKVENSSPAKRAESAMFGSSDVLKSRAYEVLLETADGLPQVATKQYFTVPVAVPVPTRPAANGILDSILDLEGVTV